ncbi:hypothetical protein HYDPIDRAFT_100430 [Hydnomerulius pinastri MD-312]|uniref:WD40 repeat-like protein n=1 Tax=Hydnomerulius pinastri MD-312 TaxID=994086 RepID=A0A0C9W8W9_9AGAM|nr:hypothetical protein HYDPIDRAFT_100430 [Hydnomerulius pinastri MD-312]
MSPEPPERSPAPLATYEPSGSVLPLATYTGHSDNIQSIAFLPDSKHIVSGSFDGSMRVWSLTQGDEVEEAERHSHWVRSLSFSRDSSRVASASDYKSVIVWSTSTGKRLAGPFTGHTGWVYCVAFSPDAERLATCDLNAMRIWHSHSSELALPPIHTHDGGGARSLSWTPGGNQIVAGCVDNSIRIFDTLNGSQIARWVSHTSSIWSIAISRDSRYIVSGSFDKTVKLWDATTHQQMGPALQHDEYVWSVCISPDAKYIASAGYDKTVMLWSLRKLVDPSYTIDQVRDPAFMILSHDLHVFFPG